MGKIMKISILCDSYKESLSGFEVGEVITENFKKVYPDAEFYINAIADGGEGTLDTLVKAKNGDIKLYKVNDPLNREVDAKVGFNDDLAIIESAEACGLHLLTVSERNPLVASSYGVGQILKRVIQEGHKNILICLGGTATNDMGLGLLNAIGYKFMDDASKEVPVLVENFENIKVIDDSEAIDLSGVKISVAVDVKNSLLGKMGASHVFGPQKGAKDVQELDDKLSHINELIIGKYDKDLNVIEGGGAAGGIAAVLSGLLNAELKPGFELVCDYLELESEIKNSDLVITGEGRMDSQSVNGKGPIGVALVAKKYSIPTIAICGSLSDDIDQVYDYGITSAYSIMKRPCQISDAIAEAKVNLSITAHSVARTLKAVI